MKKIYKQPSSKMVEIEEESLICDSPITSLSIYSDDETSVDGKNALSKSRNSAFPADYSLSDGWE